MIAQQSNEINKPMSAAVLLLCVAALPSILLLSKVAIALLATLAIAIAISIVSQVVSGLFQKSDTFTVENGQARNVQSSENVFKNSTKQDKIIKAAVGITSLLVAGMLVLAIAEMGLIASCSVVAALAICACEKRVESPEYEKLGKFIDDKAELVITKVESYVNSCIEKSCVN